MNQTIENSLARFFATSYISDRVTSPALFDSQVQSLESQFQLSTTNEFLSSLRIVRDIIQANFLLSALQTNVYTYWDADNRYVSIGSEQYHQCVCLQSAMCVVQGRLYDPITQEIVKYVPGVLNGCFVVEALLQSTLECFFDQQCFDEVTVLLSSTVLWNGTVLDDQMKSRFSPTTPVGEMLQVLMVEEWDWSSAYGDYFNECRPVQCSYTVRTRNDVIIIVTTVVGLIGGLVTALKLIVPCIVWLSAVEEESTSATKQVRLWEKLELGLIPIDACDSLVQLPFRLNSRTLAEGTVDSVNLKSLTRGRPA